VLNRSEGLVGAVKDLFSKDYKIIKAVDDISMEIGEREIVAFVGPNGAGKSTTIKMLTGILEPSGGELVINNLIPFKNRQRYIRDIGVVFGQRTSLWWELPVIESFKILMHIYKIDKSSYDQNMGLFNELVDLKRLYSTPVRNLSLGQRMLCDIVAAFLHDPKIIYLDEPTIGLDVSVKSKIRLLIQNLNTIKNSTIMLTSHDIADIEKLCKRIILIDKGKIVYDGAIERFNKIFGSYRTLRLKTDETQLPEIQQLTNLLHEELNIVNAVTIEKKEDGWCNCTINQDQTQLLPVLNFFLKRYTISDISIEDVRLEHVLQKMYEGALP
jgi:ABC-2 type transport system ATP-binding protein